jgi:hypothetical protein
MARRTTRQSLRNERPTETIYKGFLTEDITVRDFDLKEYVLKEGTECEVLLEITCADGIHVRIRAPEIPAPTWFHKKFLKLGADGQTKTANVQPTTTLPPPPPQNNPTGTVKILFKK